jgi:hypothetical protein
MIRSSPRLLTVFGKAKSPTMRRSQAPAGFPNLLAQCPAPGSLTEAQRPLPNSTLPACVNATQKTIALIRASFAWPRFFPGIREFYSEFD